MSESVGDHGDQRATLFFLRGEWTSFEKFEIENAPIARVGLLQLRLAAAVLAIDRDRFCLGERARRFDAGQRVHPIVDQTEAGIHRLRVLRPAQRDAIEAEHAIEPRLRLSRREHVVEDRRGDDENNKRQRDAEKRDERKELSATKYFERELEIAAHHATCRPSKSRTMRSVRLANRSSCVTITTVVFSF